LSGLGQTGRLTFIAETRSTRRGTRRKKNECRDRVAGIGEEDGRKGRDDAEQAVGKLFRSGPDVASLAGIHRYGVRSLTVAVL
jgi:hypothetical protein